MGQPRQERRLLAPATRRSLTASAAADFRVPHPRTLAACPGPARPAVRALPIERSSEGRSAEPTAVVLLAVSAVAQRSSAPPPQLRQDWSCAKAGAVRLSGFFVLPQLLSLVGYLCEIQIAPALRQVQELDPPPTHPLYTVSWSLPLDRIICPG